MLDEKGEGFVPAEGPVGAWLLIVGEAAGYTEALTGRPFVGDAGGMLQRLFNLLGWSRDAIRIHNSIACHPPGDWFDERAPWYHGALAHCPYLEQTFTERPTVVVPMGATALKRVLHLEHKKKVKVQDFHGAIVRDPTDRFWVVPTYHPSFLQRGATNLIGTVLWDLRRAEEARESGRPASAHTLVVDPPIDWFRMWVDQVVAARQQDPGAYPISSDVETPDKAGGKDEGEITAEDVSFQILRINVACHTDEGVTVPYAGPYIDELRRLHQSPGAIWGWNCPTPDQRVLTADLRWVRAGDLAVGDALVGFDETPTRPGPLARRRYRTAHVTHADRHRADVYAVHLSDGHCIKVTGEHRWYTRRKLVFGWVRTDALRVGQRIQRLFPTWRTGASWQHGYLAGFFDGEGSLSLQQSTRTVRLAATQRRGPTLDYVRTVLQDCGFNHAPKFPSRAKDAHVAAIQIQGGMGEIACFLGEVRPPRLLPKFAPEHLGALQSWRKHDVSVVAIEHLGEQEIVGLTTSTHTYVLEGFGAHNCDYDFPRMVAAGQQVEADHHKWIDLMWLAHFLQSDIPRGLGFWAPFYSNYGPWKHLADDDPAVYGAADGLQTHRVGFGVIGDLIAQGQYHWAMRHTHRLHTEVLRPAQLVGLKVDRPRLLVFKQSLIEKARERLQALQGSIPESLQPLTPKLGLTRRPAADVLHVKASAFTRKGTVRKGKPTAELKQELYSRARVVEKLVLREVLACATCGAIEIPRRHRCKADPADPRAERTPVVEVQVASVTRWFWQEPFNPDSVPQVLAYIKHKKHRPGRAKKSQGEESTNRETLERLARTTNDPFYGNLLDYRAIGKVKGTYVEGTERRLDAEDRLHPVPTFKPSTMRLSYTNPNITNVVADKGGTGGLAAGFRHCIVASPGCRLLEVDFSAIEAVETGWCARDAEYYRLAKLGVHAALVTHAIGKPYDPSASDEVLRALFKATKHDHPAVYEPAKRYIHGRAYGLTVAGMVLQFPHLFPTQAVAEKYARIFERMAPRVAAWQQEMQVKAQRQHYLGGQGDHPFGYKHWFWSVYSYKRLTTTQYYRLVKKYQGGDLPAVQINGQWFRVSLGEDGKRVLAFYPQSIAAGILKEALLRLFAERDSPSYIGDVYFGRTPLRAPIHDSLLLEIPDRRWDRTVEIVCMEMQRPVIEQPLPATWGRVSECVAIGVAAKAGSDWGAMEEIAVPGYDHEWVAEPIEDDDADDWDDLSRVIA